jgi:hypothetical protein
MRMINRALDPPPPPPPVDPLANMSESDRLALGLLKQGDVLSGVVDRIVNLAQAPDRIESSTWKDKLADAGLQLVTQNPQVIATVTDIASRAVVALATAFAPRGTQQTIAAEPIPPQAVNLPPPRRINATPPQPLPVPQAVNGLPETNQPEDDFDEDDDPEMDIVEELTKLMLSDKPLSLSDPIVVELRETYPAVFDKALTGIAATPSLMVIQYVCRKSEFCNDMFQSSITGPHLKKRLEELKAVIRASAIIPPEVREKLENQEQQEPATAETPGTDDAASA